MSALTIHATNVTGLGASQVVHSFLTALDSLNTPFSRIVCYIPESGPISDFKSNSCNTEVIRIRRRGPKAFSRALECIFPELFFDTGDQLIVLGDVPLRTRTHQAVFVHQPHLQAPAVNPRVRRDIVFRVMRGLTRLNAEFADHVIVQTEVMADGLRKSYRAWADEGRINVIGQPPPLWFRAPVGGIRTRKRNDENVRLFYPAADYPHKNHVIFEKLDSCGLENCAAEIILTVPNEKFHNISSSVHCLGELTHSECLRQYSLADALVFPSILESYGLPLVEAMAAGLPILVADLPYARTLCGNQGIYFDPDSGASLRKAIMEFRERIDKGWAPDWSSQLIDLPKDWQEVVRSILDVFDN